MTRAGGRVENAPNFPGAAEEISVREDSFIVRRLAAFGEDNPPADIEYLDELLAGFGDAKMAQPHVTVLNKRDVWVANKRRGGDPEFLQTRGAISGVVNDLSLPPDRHCHTQGADIFGPTGSTYFVGFHLDDAGRKIVKRERSKLFRGLGLPSTYNNYSPHVSLARSKDPLYARYVADSLNATIGRPLSMTLSEVTPSEPLGFKVQRDIPQGLPATRNLVRSLERSLGDNVIGINNPVADLLTAREGMAILDRFGQRFDDTRQSLMRTLGALAPMAVAQVHGVEAFEAEKSGKKVDVVALALDRRYASAAEDERKRLFDSVGVDGDTKDNPTSRLGVAIVRDRSLTQRTIDKIRYTVPPGRQIFFGQAVLKIFQDRSRYIF